MSYNRVISLIDMDCFYCQVEIRADPSLKGKPVAVVQYNSWKGGGIIAVNYEARAVGINRGMRGDEALKKCPDIKLVSVPEIRGKADLTRYRNAGREVVAVLCEFSSCVEKASIDEAYIDLTDAISCIEKRVSIKNLENTFVVGYNPDQKGTKQWLSDIYHNGINDKSLLDLARGSALVEEIRIAIFKRTGFHCSAGISHNKVLAKLACGINKPNRQTVLPITSVPKLFSSLPLKKIRSLGGKLGDAVQEQLNITNMGEIAKFSLNDLQRYFGEKNGLWLYNMARGINLEPVKPRLISKSIGCCKNFKGPSALISKEDVKHWLSELAAEIVDRIEDDMVLNNRRPTVLVVSIQQELSENAKPISKTLPYNNCDREEIARSTFVALSKYNKASSSSPSWSPALIFLGLSTGKFVEDQTKKGSLLNFFKPVQKLESSKNKTENICNNETKLMEIDCESEQTISYRENQNHDYNDYENVTNLASSTDASTSVSKQEEKLDFRKSFFCKYFASKRLPEKLNDDANKKLCLNSDDLSTNGSDDSDSRTEFSEPKPGTSKSSSEDKILFEISPSKVRSGEVYSASDIIKNEKSVEMNGYCNVDQELSNDAFDALEICAECNKPVKLIQFLEHLDHHMASKLQKEFDTVNVHTTEPVETSHVGNKNLLAHKSAKKGVGDKRKIIKNKSANSPAKGTLSITNFFQVKPQL